ncbi:hypothetical protein [Mycobacterium deserti]|uniref:Uncharacterized protein n=1 Tax=Mycobacterium deserti TaxID=2978347 RepID=A0ABT2MGM1_9MYCO|nr:hypothetical protein [Mycobacterium deserti]MCT7661407.1 hypothetical protein [Mycobacterium deserti]
MTELAQSHAAAERKSPGSDYLPPPAGEMSSGGQRPRGGVGVWRVGVGVAGAVTGLGLIAWFVFFGPGDSGARSEWFFGGAVLVAVLVSMWQTHVVLRQSRRDAADAAKRMRRELAQAQERSARELALARSIHEAEMDAQRQLARAELVAQAELARVERVHLLAQQQRLAMIEVSRAVNAHTQALAALWNQGATVLRIEDREARERAMSPIFEQISQVVKDFSVELANAHLLIEDDRLSRALTRVNEAVLAAMHVAEDVHVAVVDGHAPDPAAVSAAQKLMHERAAEARRLAWSLLRAGLDEAAADS